MGIPVLWHRPPTGSAQVGALRPRVDSRVHAYMASHRCNSCPARHAKSCAYRISALSKRLEHAELRGCRRVRPDLPTNCGSPGCCTPSSAPTPAPRRARGAARRRRRARRGRRRPRLGRRSRPAPPPHRPTRPADHPRRNRMTDIHPRHEPHRGPDHPPRRRRRPSPRPAKPCRACSQSIAAYISSREAPATPRSGPSVTSSHQGRVADFGRGRTTRDTVNPSLLSPNRNVTTNPTTSTAR